MEKQDIISSGLLELHAVGIASEKEAKDVEEGLLQYPEVAAELKVINDSMEAYANAYSITPAAGIKERILHRINDTTNGKIISMDSGQNKANVVESYPYWKMVAAACAVLLAGSVALNIFTYNKYSEAGKNLLVAKQTFNTLQEKDSIMEAGMSVVRSKYSVPVSLKGLEASPEAAAKIFWMKNTGEVYIDPSNLPDAPQGKQYQLWGIVDGKPVDGGMIVTSKKGDRYRMQKMKNFGRAEAFAVTLETEEGNPTPKGPMYVIGKM